MIQKGKPRADLLRGDYQSVQSPLPHESPFPPKPLKMFLRFMTCTMLLMLALTGSEAQRYPAFGFTNKAMSESTMLNAARIALPAEIWLRTNDLENKTTTSRLRPTVL